jgi:hypothetical protein
VPRNEQAQVHIRDFPGLVLEVDPNDLKPGASPDQVNFTGDEVGWLQTREGYLPVKFEDD